MKRFIFLLLCPFLILSCFGAGHGGRLESVSFVETNIPTNAPTSTSTSSEISGYIERIIGVVASTNSYNFDVDIVVTNIYMGTSTILYSADDVTANFDYMPRFALHDTAGVVINSNNLERLPVVRSRIIFEIGDEANTNLGFRIQVIYESLR